jgi:hypothetical protein
VSDRAEIRVDGQLVIAAKPAQLRDSYENALKIALEKTSGAVLVS